MSDLTTKETQERIEYLDLLKGAAMFLVVFCHFVNFRADSVLANIGMAAAWGGVPVFFLVSGILMLGRADTFSWKKHSKRLIHTYVIFVVWKFIYFLTYSWFGEVPWTGESMCRYLFLKGELPGVTTTSLWYMYAYLAILVIYPVFWYLKQHCKRIFLICFSAIFVRGFLLYAVDLYLRWAEVDFSYVELVSLKQFPFNLGICSYASVFFYFMLGCYLYWYRKPIRMFFAKHAARKAWPWFLMIIGVAGLVLVKHVYVGTFQWKQIYIECGYDRIFCLLLTLGIYFWFSNLEIRKFGAWIGKTVGQNTLGIYLIHYLLLAALTYKTDFYVQCTSFGFVFVKMVAAIAASAFIVWIIKKIPLLRQLVE